MAITDADWWSVRRKLGGIGGASYALVRATGDIRYRRLPYLRSKASRRRAASTRQLAQRAVLAHLAYAWNNDLSSSQRDDWNDLVDAYTPTWADAEQQPHHLTGYTAFLSSNARLLFWGLPINTDAGSVLAGYTPTTFSFAFLDADTIQATFTPAPGAYWALALYSSRPHYAGQAFAIIDTTADRDQVPHGFRPQALSSFGATSPVTLDVKRPPPSGSILTLAATFMSDTGHYGADWLTATATAP